MTTGNQRIRREVRLLPQMQINIVDGAGWTFNHPTPTTPLLLAARRQQRRRHATLREFSANCTNNGLDGLVITCFP